MFNKVKVSPIFEKDICVGVEISDLPAGFGYSMGTMLRRVLLGSLEGVAITGVRIKGVSHEFSTIDGVKNDVFEILLNLKKVKFSVNSGDEAEGELVLEKSGIVKAKDIKLPSNVKVTNPDQVIAEVSKLKKPVKISLYINKGIGYKTVNLNDRTEVGYIPLDSDFSPVKRVEIYVKEDRSSDGQKIDNLSLNIFTDGSIDPINAVKRALEISMNSFSSTLESMNYKEEVEVVEETSEVKENKWDLKTIITNDKIVAKLNKNGVKTIDELIKLKRKDIVLMKGMGKKSLEEIDEAMKNNGLSFKK